MEKKIIVDKDKLLKTYKRLKSYFPKLIIRDVIDNIDFDVEADKYIQELSYKINNNQYTPTRPYILESPKNKGINRPTVVLLIEDSLVYRYCIEEIQDELIEKTKQENIHGGKKITAILSDDGKKEYYEKWFKDWLEYNNSIINGLNFKKYAVATDIASYFDNINLLILKDLLRSDVKGKHLVLNLLFYFLENTKLRYDYEVNTYTGLLQEDIDCSRLLAYYFLSPHDEIMTSYCKNNDIEYFRYVDDMTILVNSEVDGKKSLKVLTESLRRLGLLSSIEKTSIVSSDKMIEELFINENNLVSTYESSILNKIKDQCDYNEERNNVISLYLECREKKSTRKNWIKLLKRFYSIFILIKNDLLLDSLIDDIINHPTLISGDKILKYIVSNQTSPKIKSVILKIINYLRSEENLYPLVEAELIEVLLALNDEILDTDLKKKLSEIALDIFYSKNNYSALSNYSKALSTLLIFRFNPDKMHDLANHYLKSKETDSFLKKYLLFVILTHTNDKMRKVILEKARKEQDPLLNRLVNFIDNIGQYFNKPNVTKFKDIKSITLFYNDETNYNIKENIINVRGVILKKLIEIYK